MKRTLIAALAVLWCCAAQAQSYLPFFATYGYVPTPGQWMQAWQAKQDVLGYPPLNQNGGTMLGRLVTAPPTTAAAGFSIAPGVAPTAPVNGDMWATISGLYVYVGGAVVGPLTGPSSGSFAASAPITVSFSGGVVTYGVANGASVLNPGTGTLEEVLQPQTVAGASKTYATADLFKKTRRSNSGSAMADTFPASTATGMVNGTRIVVSNTDTTASITITAGAGTSMPTGSTDVIGPGRDVAYEYDAANATWRGAYNTRTTLISAATPAAHGVVVAEGASPVLTVIGSTSGCLFLGQGSSADPQCNAATGDVSVSSAGAMLVNKIQGTVVSTPTGTGAVALANSPAFTGTPTAPTQTTGDNSTKLATDAFVQASVVALNRIATIKHVAWSSSGTYTPSTGMLFTTFDCVGGGGGSGGIPAGAASDIIMSGAGGSGSHTRTLLTAAQVTADGGTETVTIGGAGAAGTAGANSGGTGGATSVGARLTTTGGGGGGTMGAANSGAYVVPGGAPGAVGSAGDIRALGAAGRASVGVGSAGVVVGGAGGDSFFAGGGLGSSNGPGTAGTMGSGGGAAAGIGATSASAGAAGGAGFCEQWEYVNQ